MTRVQTCLTFFVTVHAVLKNEFSNGLRKSLLRNSFSYSNFYGSFKRAIFRCGLSGDCHGKILGRFLRNTFIKGFLKPSETLFSYCERLLFFAALFAVLAACPFAAAQIEPITIQPANPLTIEDKIKAAQVIALGSVETVTAQKTQQKTAGRKTRAPYVANIKVEKIYKGSPGDGKLAVLFTRSDNPSLPPLVNFSPGERVVLFLRQSDTAGYLETITPFTGKERPDYALTQKLEKTSAQQGLAGSAEATLALDTKAPQAGSPVLISFRLENKGAQPVLFNATPSPSLDLALSGPSGKTIYPPSASRDAKAASTQLRLITGAHFGYSADISKLFNLAAPGNYTLYATFKPAAGRDQTAWSGAIRANSVSFEIPKSK